MTATVTLMVSLVHYASCWREMAIMDKRLHHDQMSS